MSDNNFLEEIFKSKKKRKSPLEKFIKIDNNEEVSNDKETKPDTGIEHYGTSSTSSPPSDVDNHESKHQSFTEKKEKTAGQALIDASGLKEFNIDSFDMETSPKSPEQPDIDKNGNNTNTINIDEINKLISFLKSGNYDAAVDFIIQLKLKYNIDNIL
ncbi:hypothetical protein KAU43_09150 [candidate division WOR-3 bacterium]|nr:hypothetical protein [candidate division WOR-3 bacterium]